MYNNLKKTYSTEIQKKLQVFIKRYYLKDLFKGSIINLTSIVGIEGAKGQSIYSSSKSAIAGLSECLAEEFKEDNIKVNCLAFGAVQTEMLEKAFPGFQAPVTSPQMGEFVLDFAMYLVLSAIWLAWRHNFSPIMECSALVE